MHPSICAGPAQSRSDLELIMQQKLAPVQVEVQTRSDLEHTLHPRRGVPPSPSLQY